MSDLKPGRPRKHSILHRYQIAIREDEEPEIVAYLDKYPVGARSKAIIAAIHLGISHITSKNQVDDPGMDIEGDVDNLIMGFLSD
jgi:hypothetical protein